MQIIIHIKNNRELRFPLGYNYQLSSAVYSLLSYNAEYSAFLHNRGYEFGTGRHKLFTLSPLQGNYRIEGAEIVFDGSFFFEVRSVSEVFIASLRDGAFNRGRLKLFDTELEIGMIEVYDRHLYESFVKVKTVSPIAAAQSLDGKTLYYSPQDEEFLFTVNKNLYNKYMAAFGEEPPSIAEIIPAGRPKKVVTKIKGIWVTAYHCTFTVTAEPTVMDFLYNCGVGSKTSQGFGMIECV